MWYKSDIFLHSCPNTIIFKQAVIYLCVCVCHQHNEASFKFSLFITIKIKQTHELINFKQAHLVIYLPFVLYNPCSPGKKKDLLLTELLKNPSIHPRRLYQAANISFSLTKQITSNLKCQPQRGLSKTKNPIFQNPKFENM